MKIILILLTLILLNACDDTNNKLEKKYISDLKNWIDEGGNINTIQKQVQEPCNKLMMIMATKKENVNFLAKKNMDEYDFRVSFCMKAVINNIHSQPEFEKEMHIDICKEKIPFIKKICKEFTK
tara:strand:- start:65 stop:436 length:372 start_codon:yes stop_codon:yes gene_type:complete